MDIWDDIIKAVWENIGEGWSGDYNPNDPEDENLLRFSVYIKNNNGELEAIEDASYCTQNPYNMPEKELKEKLKTIFSEYRDILNEYPPMCSVKKLGEGLSWI